MRDHRFLGVADFMPPNTSRTDIYILSHTPAMRTFEGCLRAARCGSREITASYLDDAQQETEKVAVMLGAMLDCLRHHRASMPRKCCGGSTARCVDGREFEIPADAATYTVIDNEVS